MYTEETLPIPASEQNEVVEKISPKKPIILIFTGYYLPGYKSGGILRNILNTIDNLCDDFEFMVVTRDRDLGDENPYPDIKINEWQNVGNAMVHYISSNSESVSDLYRLICSTQHDIIYLTSFFDPFTIKVLLKRRLCQEKFKPVIVASFGEFAWASLGQKYFKKYVYIQLARFIGLYNNITWRVSSQYEKLDVINVMKIRGDSIHITGDLPIKAVPDLPADLTLLPSSSHSGLKVVFLSRIAREKNLDYALKILSKVSVQVVFDIYGPAENKVYWDECQKIITKLPPNVIVSYRGMVNPDQVVEIFSDYDLFLFPTGGEAYGNVIAESLIAGTPVLVSTETPWRNLQKDGLGWDVGLESMDAFVDIIESFSKLSDYERVQCRSVVKSKIMERLLNPEVLESNRQLFVKQLDRRASWAMNMEII